MDKAEILAAIQRCAEENGGVPVGRERFAALTGITESQWSGRHWLRWSDAVAEAGYRPGTLNTAIPDDVVLTALAELVQALGHYPTIAELKMRRREDPTFPSANVFTRFGSKPQVASRLVRFCGDDPALAEVVAIAEPIAAAAKAEPEELDGGRPTPGEVYLMKSGNRYKIGRSNATGRRVYELAIQLPDPVEVVHVIETDDAVGIEHYWHERFKSRHTNGEWFKLTSADVAAFRRRTRFM